MDKISTAKWAVENRNCLTGDSVRYIECKAESTAVILTAAANASFQARQVPHQSYWIKIGE